MAQKHECLQSEEIKRFSTAVDESIKDRRHLSERQTKIESNLVSMGEQMKEMNDKLAQILKKLDNMDERYDLRYASKQVQTIVYGACALAGVIILTAILALIIVQK